jgi:Tol biopolymer transport system component
MNDSEIQERLVDLANEAPKGVTAPAALLHRARRRAGLAIVSSIAVVVALIAGGIVGARALGAGERKPAIRPTPEPIGKDLGWITYRSGAEIVAEDPSDPSNRFSLGPAYGSDPIEWSRDGTHLLLRRTAHHADGVVTSALYVMGTDGSQTLLTQDVGYFQAGSFSPDGTEVVYGLGDQIYVTELNGAAPRLLAANDLARHRGLGDPAWSADGSLIAFTVYIEAPPFTHAIWVMNADGSGQRKLLDVKQCEGGPGCFSGLAWAPDGSKLAFSIADRGQPGVYVVGADGSGLQLLSQAFAAYSPAWSPDGSEMVFVRAGPFVYRIAADGSDERQTFESGISSEAIAWGHIAGGGASTTSSFAQVEGWIAYSEGSEIVAVDPADPANRLSIGPSRPGAFPIEWSRDGTRLLLGRDWNPGARGLGLSVLNWDGSELSLTDEGRPLWGSLSPDGTMVVYTTTSRGLYVTDASGGPARLLIADEREAFPEYPAWSPYGSQIAFIDFTEYDEALNLRHTYAVSVVNPDGSGLRELVPLGTDLLELGNITWSPDGSLLAFGMAEAPGSPAQIYVVTVDGSNLWQVTREGDNRWPTWSPDGSRIAFVRDGQLLTMAWDGSNIRPVGDVHPDGAIAWNPVGAGT